MSQTRLNEDLENHIAQLYIDGNSIKTIGYMIDHALSDSSIRNALLMRDDTRSLLRSRSNNQASNFDDDDAYMMRINGKTFAEIAEKYNVTPSTARNRILKYQERVGYLRKIVKTDSKRSKALKKAWQQKKQKEGR